LAFWDAPAAPQCIYNVAGGAHTIREVIGLALRLRPDAPVKLKEGGAKQSPYPSAYDDGPARRDWNWSPDYSIAEAVREHLEVVSRRKA
jgi:nucleoside-diphosphate-sugar epimerase